MTDSLIVTKNLIKDYLIRGKSVRALNNVDIEIKKGEFAAITGHSGSGKSTLLRIIGGLEHPDSGQCLFDGQDVYSLTDKSRSLMRAIKIGFIFQAFNLIPQMTLLENTLLPFLYNETEINDTKERAITALKQVGLEDRINHRPSELSGGEQQRGAIARAIVINPEIILADEPTGNLDGETSKEILSLFIELHKRGTTILLVTHNNDAAACAQRIITLRQGEIANTG
ncbi:MAG: ABC transporter ATP-binding protein [Nitrospirae bacterium]|nr:ABC transporter ATP-binding protein [Nitrospirota bacterium]MBF0540703.1 ABC transporter ATP-binding protein [Nitrospirota bacterium]